MEGRTDGHGQTYIPPPSARDKTEVVKFLTDRSDRMYKSHLTLLHSERPKLYGVLAFLSAIGLN